MVSYLTEELVRGGHEVTLFASGDSRTSAELVACSPVGLRQLSDEERSRTFSGCWMKCGVGGLIGTSCTFMARLFTSRAFRDIATRTITTGAFTAEAKLHDEEGPAK